MARGLILSALSGAGQSIAQSAQENQRVQDQEAADVRRMMNEQILNKQRADLQVEASNRIAEAEATRKNVANVSAGKYIKDALAENIALEAPVVTELSGIDPNSPYKEANGSPTMGLKGNYAELKQRISQIPDEETRRLGLEQLERQLAADQELAAQKIAGQTRTRNRDEALEQAAKRALADGDVAAYSNIKSLIGEKFIKVGDALVDQTGKLIYRDESKEERQQAIQDRLDARHKADREAAEARANARLDAMERGATAREAAKAEKEANKPLSDKIVKNITETRDNAVNINNLKNTFKDDFASKGVFGLGADTSMLAKGVLGTDKDAVEWWKNYKKQSELVERHAMFGASLTPGEQNSWRSADISPGMDADVIKTNLATRSSLAKRMLEDTRQDYIDAGYNQRRIEMLVDRGLSRIDAESGEKGSKSDRSKPPAPAPASAPKRPSLDDIFG